MPPMPRREAGGLDASIRAWLESGGADPDTRNVAAFTSRAIRFFCMYLCHHYIGQRRDSEGIIM